MTIPPPGQQPGGWDQPGHNPYPGYPPPGPSGYEPPPAAPGPAAPGPGAGPYGAPVPYGAPQPGPGPAWQGPPGQGWQYAPPPPPSSKTGIYVAVIAGVLVVVVAIVGVVAMLANKSDSPAASTPPEIQVTQITPSESPTDDPEPTDPPTPERTFTDVQLADQLFPYDGGMYWLCTYSSSEPLFTDSISQVFCAGESGTDTPGYIIVRWDDPQTAFTAVSTTYSSATRTTWAHGPELYAATDKASVAIRCYSELPFCLLTPGSTQDAAKTNLAHITVVDDSAVQELKNIVDS
ncbi:MAG: hypothetical protein FWD11_07450 [Micrococcales bacterium]|nr:hypothetical protein [Micrococcales bacterium]